MKKTGMAMAALCVLSVAARGGLATMDPFTLLLDDPFFGACILFLGLLSQGVMWFLLPGVGAVTMVVLWKRRELHRGDP